MIWDLSPVSHGHWSCLGVEKIALFLLFTTTHFRLMPQKTRTPRTGIVTPRTRSEWGLCRSTPPTGEQHVAIRPMPSISPTTSKTSKTLTLSTFWGGVRRAREWNTSTSEATQARIWRRLSGRSSIYPLCISTVACSRRLDSGEQVKSYAARAKRNTRGKNEGRLGLRGEKFFEILLVGQKYRE